MKKAAIIILAFMLVGIGAAVLVMEQKRPKHISVVPAGKTTPTVKLAPPEQYRSIVGSVGDTIEAGGPEVSVFGFVRVWCDPEPCLGAWMLKGFPRGSTEPVELSQISNPSKKGTWVAGPLMNSYVLEGVTGAVHFEVFR